MKEVTYRVDWWRVLADLSKAGLSVSDVAERTGIPRSTIDGYKNVNAEPKHADGERLLSLWRQKVIPQLPMKQSSVRNGERNSG